MKKEEIFEEITGKTYKEAAGTRKDDVIVWADNLSKYLSSQESAREEMRTQIELLTDSVAILADRIDELKAFKHSHAYGTTTTSDPSPSIDKKIPEMGFVDYEVAENCQNKEESYGEICVKCGKCGRKFKGGRLIKPDKTELPTDKEMDDLLKAEKAEFFDEGEPTSLPDDWENKFDKKFQKERLGSTMINGGEKVIYNYDEIKHFIRETIDQAIQTERERLLNQPANQHDQEVLKAEHKRIRDWVDGKLAHHERIREKMEIKSREKRPQEDFDYFIILSELKDFLK